MKILNSVLLLLLGVVSAVDIEELPDQQALDYAPSENDQGLAGDVQDSGLTETDYQVEEYQDDLEPLDQPSDASDEYVVDKANRLSCPFSGEACRFKKAKCVCTSRDSTIKFTIKKFRVLDDSQDYVQNNEAPLEARPETHQVPAYPMKAIEAPKAPVYPVPAIQAPPQVPAYPVQAESVPMIEYPEEHYSEEPSTSEIMSEVPAVMEGFKSVEEMEDPRQAFMNMPGDQSLHGPDAFEDKTVRIKTEDNDDKKVHEYEYLRIKKVDENGVEEKHFETPQNVTPEFSYHKGVIPDVDHSLKTNLLSSLSNVQHNAAPSNAYPVGNEVAVPSPFPQQAADYPYDPEKEQLQDRLEEKMMASQKMQMKLEEVRRRNAELMSQGASMPPTGMGYYNAPNGGVAMPPAILQAPVSTSQTVAVRGPLDVALPYTNFAAPATSQALVPLTGEVSSHGARLRSLKKSKKSKKVKKNKSKRKNKNNKVKKSKGEKNEEKMRRKMEKKRRREEKKKAKLAKKNAEKRDREMLEEMKERERIIEEKLENEKEELEETQLNASEKARLAKRLQRQQDLQQRRIDQTERNIQLKSQQQKRLEERRRVQRIRREQQLLKQQERELADLSGFDRRPTRAHGFGSDHDDDDDEDDD